MPTSINTRLWNHLQLLLPSPHHAIVTKHTCPEEGPLAVLCGDLHHHPKGTIDSIDLVGACIRVVYVTLPVNACPSPQQVTPQRLPTTSRMASIPPLRPVPHTEGTSSRAHSAGKPRHEGSPQGLQKATPLSLPSDTALHTHRLESGTRPPGDRPGPTDNPTTGPERRQTHTDHRHPPRGKMAHTKTPHDRPRPTKGPPRLPAHATHIFGL